MTTPDDIDALAGEYVLGTLDAAERAVVAARRSREPALDNAILEWEARLAPLDELTAAVAPSRELYQGIEQRLQGRHTQSPAKPVELAELQHRLTRWRRTAAFASAAAVALAIVLGLRETVLRPPQATYVAVFAKDDILPSFYLTMDLEKRELTIRTIDARKQPGKTYQLWIASEQLGPAPQSLGLIDDDLAPTRKNLNYESALLRRATFGVSLEPPGGSPTGRPTSPALHARLLPVSQ